MAPRMTVILSESSVIYFTPEKEEGYCGENGKRYRSTVLYLGWGAYGYVENSGLRSRKYFQVLANGNRVFFFPIDNTWFSSLVYIYFPRNL